MVVEGAETRSSLRQELGRGLLRLLLGAVGVLLGYSGYLLAPHLRELLYGQFGRPVGSLERLGNWLKGSLPAFGAAEEAAGGAGGPERNPTGNQPLEKLLEEVRRQQEENRRAEEALRREIGSGQRDLADQLERVRRNQERTEERLRELKAAAGSS